MLEPAEERAEVCRCGHAKREHDLGEGCCWVSEDGVEWCYCLAYDPMAWGEFQPTSPTIATVTTASTAGGDAALRGRW